MCDFSIIVPTYNRAASVRRVLETLVAQDAPGIVYEVLVVDNNSTDHTRAVIAQFVAADPRVKYLFESRPGVSNARNMGIAHAASPILAFVDDDVEPRANWLASLKRAFDLHPDADCIGGRIRARWSVPRPDWLTSAHVGAIAVQDRPAPFTVGPHNASPCLLTANFACRRSVLEEVGVFSPAFWRGQDRELQLRMWRAGKRGVYCPEVEVVVEPPADRLTKVYHRRWQATRGKYHALMWYPDSVARDDRLVPIEPQRRSFLGTPLFLYRQFLAHIGGLLVATLCRDANGRFHHGSMLWYAVSFIATRWRQHQAGITGPSDCDAPRIESVNRPVAAPSQAQSAANSRSASSFV